MLPEIDKSYDACVAVLSVHHLNKPQKQILFSKIHQLLRTGGIFTLGDIVKFDTKLETELNEELWRKHLTNEFGEREGQYWFNNYQEEDLPDSLKKQSKWLLDSGFKNIEITWQHMNYGVISAVK